MSQVKDSNFQQSVAALLKDESAGRFSQLSLAFLVLMISSCAFEEQIFKFLPGFKFYWTVAFVELLFFAAYAVVVLKGVPRKSKAPLSLYFATAVCLALSQSLGMHMNI